MKGFKGMKLLS